MEHLPYNCKWNRGMLKAFRHKTNMCFGFCFRHENIPIHLKVWEKMWEVQDSCISQLIQKDMYKNKDCKPKSWFMLAKNLQEAV